MWLYDALMVWIKCRNMRAPDRLFSYREWKWGKALDDLIGLLLWATLFKYPDPDASCMVSATSSPVCHRVSERTVRVDTRRLDWRSSMGIQAQAASPWAEIITGRKSSQEIDDADAALPSRRAVRSGASARRAVRPRNTRSSSGLNHCRQPRLATLAGVTSLAAGISTSLLRETRLVPTAAGFLVATCCKHE